MSWAPPSYPHVRAVVGPLAPDTADYVQAIPGVSYRKGVFTIPWHAVAVTSARLTEANIPVRVATWQVAASPEASWSEVEAYLREQDELREHVLEPGFLMPYQMDALGYAALRKGTLIQHPTGCLTGDTELVVNRGGAAKRMRLRELVRKFGGGGSGRGASRVWRTDVTTETQSAIDGVVLLNTVVDAFESGVKPVFRVTTRGGRQIKATHEHPFLTPSGKYVPLGELTVGATVMVSDERSRKHTGHKAQYVMRNVRYHPFAQVTAQPRSDAWCLKRGYKVGYVERSYRVPYHRLVAEAAANALDPEVFIKRCQTEEGAGLIFLDPAEYAVHHVNHDHRDNRLENLKVLTHVEHARLHAAEGQWRNVLAHVVEDTLTGIEPAGEEMTYDLTMLAPHNNYVANGFVVHNSGKSLTALIWGLCAPGALLVVTRAPARIQWAREVERFAKIRPYVMQGREATPEELAAVTARIANAEARLTRAQAALVEREAAGRSTRTIEAAIESAIRGRDRAQRRLERISRTLESYLAACRADGARAVVVVGWESITDRLPALLAARFNSVVFDESHRAKSSDRYLRRPLPQPPNPLADPEGYAQVVAAQEAEAASVHGFIKADADGSNRTLIAPRENMTMSAARLARATERRLCTSATPVKNLLKDIWAQLDLCEPGAFGNASSFKTRYCDRKIGKSGFVDDSGISNVDELLSRLRFLVHRVEAATTQRSLPPKRRQSYYIAPEDQCEPSAGFVTELKEAAKRGPTAVLEVKLAESASRKRKAVQGIIEDHLSSGHKIVVFTARRRDCERLGKEVEKIAKASGASSWWAHGEMPFEQRQEIVDTFMAHPGGTERGCVFVGTGDAFGESLNMQDADAVLFVQLPYTPGQLAQWEGRFTRIGQRRPVVIYYVIAEGTIDEHVAEILISKMPAVERVAQDADLASAADAIGGVEDPQKVFLSILAKIKPESDDDWEDE